MLNEQYKQMINVLKGSMESKIEELGLDSILEYSLSKPSKPSFIKNKVDIFAEIVKLRNEINEYKNNKKSHDQLVNSMEDNSLTLKERVKILQSK